MHHPNPLIHTKLLGLGCSTFGGSKSRKTGLHSLHTTFENGITYFDVARSYGYGQAESIVGEFIIGKRDKVILTTKFGISPPKPFPLMNLVKNAVRFARKLAPSLANTAIQSYSCKAVSRPPVSPGSAVASLERSLRELKTDYVDFFLVQGCPHQDIMNEELYERLEKEKEKGKIRVWGATCENEGELAEYFRPGSPLSVVQFPYSPDNPFLGEDSGRGFSKVVFSVMSQGYGRAEPESSFFDHLPINTNCPGLVQNLQEAWLYVAAQELGAGVILCSMTQEKHILRNIKIFEAPAIAPHQLTGMKKALITGRTYTGPARPKKLSAKAADPARAVA